MEAINAKIATLSVEMLKDMAHKLFNDTREEADVVLSAVLDRLMVIMPEDAFVALCMEIEA